MNDRRFKLGIGLTAGWILIMAAVLTLNLDQARAMKPNEWGDFFAGFFAPLAFLWLVLGYLQQGEELRSSNEALELQARELKNSVEQQQALVEVTRLQVEAEREALADERARRAEAAKPQFVFKNEGGNFTGDGQGSYSVLVANAGATATKVTAIFDPAVEGTRTILDLAMFARGQQVASSLAIVKPFPIYGAGLCVTFTDSEGREGSVSYTVRRLSPEPNSMLEFVRVEA